ncbi:MAG: sulfotransferase family protein [Gammaproteobacteria bacterium]|nr:MAG: sulfotransferase family protein [Gammaproteobacteria bacterium]
MNTLEAEEEPARRARELLQLGQAGAAALTAERALADAPRDRDLLYILAVAQRYGRQYEAADQTLQRLLEVTPGYGRAFQELGHLRRRQARDAEAMQAYQQAVVANPGLPASWKALADLQTRHGLVREAANSRAQHERLLGLPPELVSVTSFMHEGKLYKAEQLCRAFLQREPHHPEAMRLLAALGVRLHVLDDAEFLLESVLEFKPDFLLARIDYVDVLQRRQKYARALEEARTILTTDPANPAFRSLFANQCMTVGDYPQALQLYDELLAETPDNPQLNLVRGHALKTIGRQAEAIDAYRRAAAGRPGFGDAYWSLANLKTYRFEDREVAAMREQEALPGLVSEDRYHLCFALGKALEDRACYEEAFGYYTRGNTLKRETLRYSTERTELEFQRQAEVCTVEMLAARAGQGHPGEDPIFIVGLPRAGSTLIEQILASHSQVDGTLELPNILAIAHRLRGRRRVDEQPLYPGVLSELSPEQLHELGEEYLRDTAVHRQGAPRFTDKMPNNFRHIGLISLILPNARIIDARRHPMACCFSGYKQLFAEGQEFTYDLDDLGRYYRGYVELMDHWDRVLPGRILRVQHEQLVDNFEHEVRRLLEFCGLPFEQDCLEFHRTRRVVRTASSEQVRRPLNREGLEQWRHFSPWLGPLERALGPALVEAP